MPKIREVFSPKKGEKFWMIYAGKPVEATVISPPKWPNQEDWHVSVPGHPEKEWAYFWNMFPTRKECLEHHVQREQRSIEYCKERVSQYKELLKEAKKWHATWSKMLQEENNELQKPT